MSCQPCVTFAIEYLGNR